MRARIVAFVVGLALLAVGCGDSAGDLTTTSAPEVSQPSATTNTSPANTSSTSTTTTTTPPTPPLGGYVVARASLFPPDPLPGSGGASGSGCAPGPGALPDGIWYGIVIAADPDSVDLDLACFYFGEVAWEAADKQGEEAPNDFWITNESSVIRSVPVGGGAMIWSITADLATDLVALSFASEWPPDEIWAYANCPGPSCGVWVYVNGGIATELVEQYTP